ncbi:MAG: hypothetical protein HQL69_16255 [Magnetococcales bacterium]|nr:hypothetical protein [Magnetococcales bacterium]
MNMLPGSFKGAVLNRPWLLAAILLVLVSGCSSQDTSHLDPKIFADDTTWQSIKRYLSPESYWQEKVKHYSAMVDSTREHFFVESKRYRDMLTVRRSEVAKANREAKLKGEDPKTARHDIIKFHREKLDPQRAVTRELGKKLRKQMVLLDLVRHEFFKTQE